MWKAISTPSTAQGFTNNNTWQRELPIATTAWLLATGSFPVDAHSLYNNQLLINWVLFQCILCLCCNLPKTISNMPGSTELDEWHYDPLWWKSESSGLWPSWPDPWPKERLVYCYLYSDQPPHWLTCYSAMFCWETLSPWIGLVLACLTDAWSDWDFETLSSLSYLARQVDLWDYVIIGPQRSILLGFKLWTYGQANSVWTNQCPVRNFRKILRCQFFPSPELQFNRIIFWFDIQCCV